MSSSLRSTKARKDLGRAVQEALECRRLLSGYALSVLANLDSTTGDESQSGVVMDSGGNLYGMGEYGGANGDGTVFELSKSTGIVTTLASFNGSEGRFLNGSLLLDATGNLYGTADEGGPAGDGTVFELAKDSGVITILATFNGTNGATPNGGLVADSAGNLFGDTLVGGANDDGTVFEVAKASGVITTLASAGSSDAAEPPAGLIIDSAGNLYGTSFEGGANGVGSVFELAKGSGIFTVLASFNTTGGHSPEAGLVMDSAGNLYGTTSDSGVDGTAFEVAKGSGVITTVATFNGTNAGLSASPPLIDAAGDVFGAIDYSGDADADGTLFEVNHGSGVITSLAAFNLTDGATPSGTLSMDSAGNIYGATIGGGASDVGVIFELSPVPPAQLAFTALPSTAVAGASLSPPVTVTAEDVSGNVVMAGSSTVTLTIAAGPDGATLGGTTSVRTVNGVATFTNLSLNTPGAYTLVATDGSLTTPISSILTVTAPPAVKLITPSSKPASAILPTLGHLVLPVSVLAGGKIKTSLPVVLTNGGNTLKGAYTVNLYADTANTLDGNQVLISTVSKNLSVSAGQAKTIDMNLKSLPATLANGTYHLLAQVVDPTGAANFVASSQTVTVAAPFVTLAAAAGSVAPLSISLGKSGTIAIAVTDIGNMDVSGLIDLTLHPSSDGVSPLPGITLATVMKKANLRSGQSKTFKLRFKPGTLTAGNYFPFFSISLGGNSTTAVGPQFTVG